MADEQPVVAEPQAAPVTIDPQEAVKQEAAERQLISEVKSRYTKARQQRKPHEGNWFRAGAFFRGQQHVEYNEGLAKLVSPATPSYRVKLDLNRIRPKIRARLSKFFRGRPKPVIVPASTEAKDILSARASEKILGYHWDRLHLEEKYKDARLWAAIASKGLWWIGVDEGAISRIQTKDPLTGATTEQEVVLPDVMVEVGSPFELLVADPAISRIGDQPWIQRVRMVDIDDVRQRYPDLADELDEQTRPKGDKPSIFSDRLATLRADGNGGNQNIDRPRQVLQIEEFTAPCAKYPKGRKVVLIEEKLAKVVEELPFGLWDHKLNPYPVVEFTDSLTPGQYWGTTVIDQLIDVQRQYNYLFELLIENTRATARPKIIIYKQHNLAEGAYTNAPGEILELTYVPGLPAPVILQPASISGDIWNLITFLDRMFDEITQVYPAAEGAVAKSTSGFQTNLLQEATDSVHAPDVREDELALQDAAWKIRRICKLLYDVPRLFSIMGENSMPEAMEFSASQINEFAEVRIQVGSMLPDLKAAKAQTALDLYKANLFGNPADPSVRRRVLSMLDMGGLEVVQERERLDTDEAELENRNIRMNAPVEPPQFNQDHAAHYETHAAFMKSPAYKQLMPEQKNALLAHLIQTVDWMNPTLSWGLRQQYEMIDLPIATPPLPPMAPPGEAGDPNAGPPPQSGGSAGQAPPAQQRPPGV